MDVAVGENQCPPFCQICFLGGVPLCDIFAIFFQKFAGGWVKIKLKLPPHTFTYQIYVVFRFNPMRPLQQQLALLLPGA